MARMTNTQLTDENIRLRAQCNELERQLHEVRDAHQAMVTHRNKLAAEREELRAQLATRAAPRAQAPAAAKPDARDYGDYLDYANAARNWCRANKRPVSYKSREQFADAHAGVES